VLLRVMLIKQSYRIG